MHVCPSVCHTCGQRGPRSGRATKKLCSVPRTLYVFNIVHLSLKYTFVEEECLRVEGQELRTNIIEEGGRE